jgi:hypothetical protein
MKNSFSGKTNGLGALKNKPDWQAAARCDNQA